MIDYNLASELTKKTEKTQFPEEIKKEVSELMSKSKLTDDPLTEQGAFVEWLKGKGIDKEYIQTYKQLQQIKKSATTFEQADLYDELLIEEQVIGAKPLVYEIPSKTGSTYVLSWEGLTEAMLRQGNIRVGDIEFKELGGKVIAIATVDDLKRNITMKGVAEVYQSEKSKYTTLSSKAIRNALRKIVSNKYQQQIIKEAITAKAVIVLNPRG